MDSTIKQQWTDALRSGKYRQGKGALAGRDGSKHLRRCCLGVLCDIMPGVERHFAWGDACATYEFEETSASAYLPFRLQEKIGLSREDQRHLARLNDGQPALGINPKSFSEIADWIDANL